MQYWPCTESSFQLLSTAELSSASEWRYKIKLGLKKFNVTIHLKCEKKNQDDEKELGFNLLVQILI